MEKPEGLNWNAAGMELPEMPMVSPGADAMSATIAGVLPMLAAELTASVAALNLKENMFSGKLTAAESAYQNADDSGSQSVGQLGSMLGDLGKMAQSAGGGSGGGGGIFGSLMETAMKMAEGMGGKGGDQQDPNAHGENPHDPNARGESPQTGGASGAGGQVAMGQASNGATPATQTAAAQAPAGGGPRDDSVGQDDREHQHDANRDGRPPVDAAGPGDSQRGAGQAPVSSPDPGRHGAGDDLARNV